MRTSHIQIKRKITDEKNKLTDKEIFTSNQFSAYLTDIAEAVTQRYKRKIKVALFYDASKEAKIACTDNSTVSINTGNYITQGFSTKILKTTSILGLLAHEIGHILYSDFIMLSLYQNTMKAGSFYPQEPEHLTKKQEEDLEKIRQYFDSKNIKTISIISQIAFNIINILEDVYIEERICNNYAGLFKEGILLNNLQLTENIVSIKKQLEQGINEIAILINLILSYARTGEINNLGDYEGPLLDTFYECIPMIDNSIYEDDARVRFQSANKILIILFPYVEELISKIKEDNKNGTNKIEKQLKEQIEEQIPLPTSMSSKPIPTEESKSNKKENNTDSICNKGKEELNTKKSNSDSTMNNNKIEVVEYERGRIKLTKTEEIEETGSGGIIYNRNYEGSGYVSKAASDIERIMTSIAEKNIYTNYEKELLNLLQNEADNIRYGNVHKNIHINVNRMLNISSDYIQEYQKIAPPLLLISKRLQKQVLEQLKQYMTGGKLENLPFGKRINARNTIHQNGKIFYKTTLPQETIGIAVAILNDESGSMSSCDRITYARATSIILYDFCKQLQIPICIYGHSTKGDNVELYCYAEYDSIDNKNIYRLMDISARNGNRDGAALRFVAERLMKRPEELKLLFLISDGQPSAIGYSGTEAEADLRQIKKEYKNKGIHLFAAAIGDDKENIKEIYGDSFLDINNLPKLPQNLGKLLIHYIKQQIN